ncbi:MAG: sirohydrochlorin chelatase [Propioniciclava sp.]
MAAPALLLVAEGGADPRVERVAHEIRLGLSQARPEIRCDVAFLGQGKPAVSTAVTRLTSQSVSEIVMVSLDLANAVDIDPTIVAAGDAARAAHPGVAVSVARPVGPEASLLGVLDARLRSALSAARVLELDGLVLCAASTGDVRGASLLARRTRQWSTHHRLPCLVAVADGSGPTVAQAVQGLRSQGRRHIAVGSLFWGHDEKYAAQAELAERVGVVAVSEPLGSPRELIELILARYAFAAMDLLDVDAHTANPLIATDAQLTA